MEQHKSAAQQEAPNSFLFIPPYSWFHTNALWLLWYLKSVLHDAGRKQGIQRSHFNIHLLQQQIEQMSNCALYIGVENVSP